MGMKLFVLFSHYYSLSSYPLYGNEIVPSCFFPRKVIELFLILEWNPQSIINESIVVGVIPYKGMKWYESKKNILFMWSYPLYGNEIISVANFVLFALSSYPLYGNEIILLFLMYGLNIELSLIWEWNK